MLLKFKDGTPKEKIAATETNARQLLTTIRGVQDLEFGKNISPENKNQGFMHCFFLTFKNKDVVATYLPHPNHRQFVSLLSGVVEQVLVIDYIAQ